MIDLRKDPMALNNIMTFDHVIEVHADGTVTDRDDVYAPSLYDDELGGDTWTLLNGFSGQYLYSGPMMHQSEYVGGTLAKTILANPGLYVALINSPTDETEPESWAVAQHS